MKKFITGIIIGALLMLSIPVSAAIEEYILYKADYRLVINGAEYSDPELPLLNYKGYTYAPIRSVFEAAGLDVDWNGEMKQANVSVQQQTQPEHTQPEQTQMTPAPTQTTDTTQQTTTPTEPAATPQSSETQAESPQQPQTQQPDAPAGTGTQLTESQTTETTTPSAVEPTEPEPEPETQSPAEPEPEPEPEPEEQPESEPEQPQQSVEGEGTDEEPQLTRTITLVYSNDNCTFCGAPGFLGSRRTTYSGGQEYEVADRICTNLKCRFYHKTYGEARWIVEYK